MYLANPSTAAVRDAMTRTDLGCIVTPAQGNRLPEGVVWGADNGCGPGKDGKTGAGFRGYENYLGWLQDLTAGDDLCDPDRSGCLFAVAPDVVGDASATLRRESMCRMLGWIRHIGLPAAFVAQDGQEDLPAPWDDLDVLFVGGSTAWKLGAHARALVAEAKRRGKRAHMGRVNSRRRLRYAARIGCDTADGTYLAYGPDVNLPVLLSWLADVNGHGALLSVAEATGRT